MKKNKNSLNIVMYVLIGLILVVLVVLFIPENNKTVDDNPQKEETVNFVMNDISVSMKVGEEKSLNYTLSGEYTISWYSSNNNVAVVEDGVVKALTSGSTIITGTITINGNVRSISCSVTVLDDTKEEKPKEVEKPTEEGIKLEKVIIKSSTVNVTIGDTKKIEYRIEPEDATITSINWESSDTSIAIVNDGNVKGLKEGLATVTLTINKDFIGKVNINVTSKTSDVTINSYPKVLIRVGESTSVSAKTVPSGGDITYKSSNTSVATVDSNGKIVGKGAGSTKINLSAGGKDKTIDINVLPKKGLINGSGNLWGYKSLNAKKHVRAGTNYFKKLADSGRGTLSGNTYKLSDGSDNYTYYIDRSMLVANGRSVMLRIYYPENTDLSTSNTLTYMGGDGEMTFHGLFGSIEKDISIIDNNGGIVILVAEGNNTEFNQYVGVLSTKFVQACVKQKSGVRNSIIGFSTGGTKVMGAANLHNYDRVIVFSSYYNWAGTANNLKNKEIMFYIPNGDTLYKQAKETLRDMKKAGYTNVTIVTNSSELVNLYKDTFLVINVGSLMTNAHVTKNVTDSNVISYANE